MLSCIRADDLPSGTSPRSSESELVCRCLLPRSFWTCVCGPWNPLAVMSSAGKSPSQTEHYTYQNEFFSCDFPLDQVSAEPRIRTRAETERSMPGHFPWSLDNQLWGGGGKRGEEFNQSRPHEGFPKHSHVENPTLLLIGVKFLLPLFDHISSGEDHKLWEVWPWIYQCRLNWVGCTEGFITGFFPLLYMLGKVPSLKG